MVVDMVQKAVDKRVLGGALVITPKYPSIASTEKQHQDVVVNTCEIKICWAQYTARHADHPIND